MIASEKPFKYLPRRILPDSGISRRQDRNQQKNICDNTKPLEKQYGGRHAHPGGLDPPCLRARPNRCWKPPSMSCSVSAFVPVRGAPPSETFDAIYPEPRGKRQGISVVAFHLLGQPVPTELIDNTRATCLESLVKVPIIN